MRNAAIKVFISVCFLFGTAGSFAAAVDSVVDSPPAAAITHPATIGVAGTPADGPESASVEETAAADARTDSTVGESSSSVDLSILAVLALGIIGLFWIRRHTREL